MVHDQPVSLPNGTKQEEGEGAKTGKKEEWKYRKTPETKGRLGSLVPLKSDLDLSKPSRTNNALFSSDRVIHAIYFSPWL